MNIVVYELGDLSAQLVRWSLGKHDDTMYVNLYETHFSYIQDMKSYSHSYLCRKCENSMWKYPSLLLRHERACEGGDRRIYKVVCTILHLRSFSDSATKESISSTA